MLANLNIGKDLIVFIWLKLFKAPGNHGNYKSPSNRSIFKAFFSEEMTSVVEKNLALVQSTEKLLKLYIFLNVLKNRVYQKSLHDNHRIPANWKFNLNLKRISAKAQHLWMIIYFSFLQIFLIALSIYFHLLCCLSDMLEWLEQQEK